jgi:hypothetical protein
MDNAAENFLEYFSKTLWYLYGKFIYGDGDALQIYKAVDSGFSREFIIRITIGLTLLAIQKIYRKK